MRKTLIIILVAGALLTMLVFGTVAGGALAYFLLRANSAQAAAPSAEIVQRVEPVPAEGGVLVSSVVPGSPAEEAGIVRGDILIAVEGREVNSLAELHTAVEELANENESVAITLQHGDEQRTVAVTLGNYIDQPRLGIEACGAFFGHELIPPQVGGEGMVVPFESSGVMITEVIADSPAEAAGLQVGDVITAVNDQEISTESPLADVIQGYKPGDEITLTVERQDEALQLTVELGENADDSNLPYLGVRYSPASGMFGRGERVIPFEKFPFQLPDGENMPFFGLPFNEMPGMPSELPEEVENGAVIVEVTPDSPAAAAGLQVGDVIVAAGDEAISGPDQLVDTIQSLKPGDELTLKLYRSAEDQPLEISVVLAENPDKDGQPYLGVRITEFTRLLDDSQNPGGSFFHNFPFPPPEDWQPLQEEPGPSA